MTKNSASVGVLPK